MQADVWVDDDLLNSDWMGRWQSGWESQSGVHQQACPAQLQKTVAFPVATLFSWFAWL